jgi:hypothetical protein
METLPTMFSSGRELQQLCHKAAASSLRVGVVGGVAGVKGMALPAQVHHRREKLEQRREHPVFVVQVTS